MARLGKNRQKGEGNTELPPKQPTRKTFWCFTLFNFTDEIKTELNRQLESISVKFLYGEEVCPSTQKLHLQGFFHLKKAMRITEIKLINNPHLSWCMGNEAQNIKYCSKENKVFKWGFPAPLKLINPDKDWQIKILTILSSEPDDRKVYWFWSKEGGVGKSQFCKYLIATMNCVFIDEGKKADIMYSIMEADMDKCNSVIFDIPRDNGNKVSYKSIESIKNGMVYSPKYESKHKLFNSPHLICFANCEPEFEKLSNDRWVVEEIF
jgi:hypothetical protein